MFAAKTAMHLRSLFVSALKRDKASKNKKLLEFLDSLHMAHMGFVLSAKAQIPHAQKQRLMSSTLFTSFISQDVLGVEPAISSSPIESTALALDLIANIHLKFVAVDALRLFLSGLSCNLEDRRGKQQQQQLASAAASASYMDSVVEQAVLANEEQEMMMLAQSLKGLLQLHESAHCSSAPPSKSAQGGGGGDDGSNGGDGEMEMEASTKKQVAGPLKNEANNIMQKVKLTTFAQQLFVHELGSLPLRHIQEVQEYMFVLCQHGHYGAGNNLFVHFERHFDVSVVEAYLLILVRAKEWERLEKALLALKRRGEDHKVVGMAHRAFAVDIASVSAAASIVEREEGMETEAPSELLQERLVLEEEKEDGLGARGEEERKREEGEEGGKEEEREAWLYAFVESTIEQILVHKAEILALNSAHNLANLFGYKQKALETMRLIRQHKVMAFAKKGKWQMAMQLCNSRELQEYLFNCLQQQGMSREANFAYTQFGLLHSCVEKGVHFGALQPVSSEELEEQAVAISNSCTTFPLKHDCIIFVDCREKIVEAAQLLGLSLQSAERVSSSHKEKGKMHQKNPAAQVGGGGGGGGGGVEQELIFCGLDSEWRASFTRGGYAGASILQVSIKTHVFIFDLRHLGSVKKTEEERQLALALFCELFSSSRHVKIGWVFDRADVAMLTEAADGYFAPAFRKIASLLELEALCKKASRGEGESYGKGGDMSLSDAAHRFLGRPLNKGEQVSNWDARPLEQSQLVYAALDAHCLLGILDAILLSCSADGSSSSSRGIGVLERGYYPHAVISSRTSAILECDLPKILQPR